MARIRVPDWTLSYPGSGCDQVMAALRDARDRQLRAVVADLRSRASSGLWPSAVSAALSIIADEYEQEVER